MMDPGAWQTTGSATSPAPWSLSTSDVVPVPADSERSCERVADWPSAALSIRLRRMEPVTPRFGLRSISQPWPLQVTVTKGHEGALERHLSTRPGVREALLSAMARLREADPDMRFVIGLYRDPEEDWAYPLVVVVPSPEIDREWLRDAVDRITIETLERFEADAETWFSFTLRPVWPEARF